MVWCPEIVNANRVDNNHYNYLKLFIFVYRKSQQRHRSAQSRHNNNHRPNGNSSNGSGIPLQPTAPPLQQVYQPQAYTQTQLTVALPPESSITFTSASSNRTINEPPPPYIPALPPRPSSLATQNLVPTTNSNNSANLNAGGSVNSCSSTNSSNNLLPSRQGFSEGRGYYNRKQNANVPTKPTTTKSNSQSVSSSSSSKHSAGSKQNSANNSKKTGKK